MATKKLKQDTLTPSQKDDAGAPVSLTADQELAMGIVERWNRLDEVARYYLSQWEAIGAYVMPRKSYILTTLIVPDMDREANLFTSIGVQSNMTLASGCMSYITPSDSRWFALEPTEPMEDDDDAREWFAHGTEIVQQYLANSNFYTTMHEFYLDRGCFGTAVLHVEPGDTDDTPLIFRTFDVGKFRLSENHERLVDTLFYRDKFTVRQLVLQFGAENVSEFTRKKYEQADGRGYDFEVEVIHAIYPRPDSQRDKTKKDGRNKQFASVYVEVETKHTLRNGGYDEKPFFGSRYLSWQKSAYGYSPSWVVMPTLKQLNLLEKNLDALSELSAFPRVLVPDGMANQVDLRAGGVTYYNSTDPNAKPVEWATAGRYDIGIQRVEHKEAQVKDAFSVPLFQQFTQDDEKAGSPITATQVRAMQAEQLSMFSPTFSRLTTEVLTPLIKRVTGILIRQGKFPPPPASLIKQNAKGEQELAEPKITFTSKMALAVKGMEVQATDRSLQRALQVIQITRDPSVLDNFDMDKILKGGAINDGVDPDYIRPDHEVQTIRQQRQKAAAQQAQMQQQQHMADVAAKAGSIKSDSMLGQQIQKNAPQVGSAY